MTDLLRSVIGSSPNTTSLPTIIRDPVMEDSGSNDTANVEVPTETAIRSSQDDWTDAYKSISRRMADSMVRRRWGSLLTLLAHLEDMPFERAASILGTSPSQLARYIRAEASLPRAMFSKVSRLDEIVRNVLGVLDSSAISEWFETPIPALNGRTPADAIRHRQAAKVLLVAKSYNEPTPHS
jgi:hypothetical protein